MATTNELLDLVESSRDAANHLDMELRRVPRLCLACIRGSWEHCVGSVIVPVDNDLCERH